MSEKIFLVGLPGAGKTTLGMELANDLGIPFVDLDLEIEKHTKNSIREIFSEKGESHFRQLEKYYLNNVINDLSTFVMATGGGTPCFYDNMEAMNLAGSTVFIDVPIETIKKRLEEDTTRPLMKKNTLEDLLENRIGWYDQASHTIQNYQELLQLFS